MDLSVVLGLLSICWPTCCLGSATHLLVSGLSTHPTGVTLHAMVMLVVILLPVTTSMLCIASTVYLCYLTAYLDICVCYGW